VTSSKQRPRGRIAWVMLGGLAVILGSSVALAQEVKLGGKLRTGGEVVVAADETVTTDLYVSGGQIRIEGTVEGDVLASGGQVQVTGQVGGDLTVGSGNVDLSGEVTGDARIGAGQVTVSGTVGEDLAVGSGQLTLSSSGTVGEDLLFGTGQTSLDGTVEGNVVGSTGNYSRNGTIGGTEDVNVLRRKEPTFGDRLLDALQRFVAILIVGALLLWLFPRSVEGAAATLRRRPWASLGVGLLGLVGFIVLCVLIVLVCILLAIGLGLIRMDDLVGATLFGGLTALTGAGFVFYLAIAFLAWAVVGLTIGQVMIGIAPVRRWIALALGVLIVVIVSSIPVVGGWLGFVIALFGLGALILEFWPWRRREPEPVPAPAVP
jgi:cytoskeletal protein CcmA (bactofilin family)